MSYFIGILNKLEREIDKHMTEKGIEDVALISVGTLKALMKELDRKEQDRILREAKNVKS